MRAYADDLAYIHDSGFTGFAEAAAEDLVALLRRAGHRRGLVVDLGCGSGGLSQRITGAGYDALGIDLSPAFLALARRRAPAARFRRGSGQTEELPPCVAVVAVGEVLNYRFDRRNSNAALARFFRRVHAALEPGGIFLFDLAGPGRAPGGSTRTFATGRDWAVTAHAVERGRVLTRTITTFRRVRGRSYRRGEETHELLLHDRRTVAAQLREAGFRVTTRRSYGSTRLPTGWNVFLARTKKGRPRREPAS